MPIGKNSIKRVANAGYSSVKTEAPDMENSTEVKLESEKPAVKKKAAATEKAATVSKKSTQTTAKKTVTPVKKAAQRAAEPLVTAKKFALGDELPTYLL